MKKRPDGRYLKVVTINGKRVYFYSTEDTEKKAAKDIERQMIAFKEKLHILKHNFGELLSETLISKEKRVAYQTMQSYMHTAKKLTELAEYDIEEITPEMLQNLVDGLAEQDFSKSTLQKVKIVISLVYEYAVKHGVRVDNCAKHITVKSNVKKERKRPLSDAEIAKIIANHDKPFGMFPYILCFTGMRRGELGALQKKDIDTARHEIRITKAVEYRHNQPCIKTTKTDNSNRTIPVIEMARATIYDYIKDMRDDDYLFGGEKPLSVTAVNKRWKKYCDDAGLIGIKQHMLRHTFSYISYRSGIDAKTLQGLLGHADVQTSLNIYTDFSDEVKRSEMEKANKLFRSIAND